MKRSILGLFLFVGLIVDAAPAPPFPHSPVIREMVWHWDTYTNAAPGSDLWPITWGADDNLYTAWGDGGGFGGTDHDGRVAMGFGRIEGFPDHWRGININGGKNPEYPASFKSKGKTGELVCVDGVLYAIVNMQDGKWPDVTHRLFWSTNYAATWTAADWLYPRGAGTFRASDFLQFGKDYTGVPPPLDSAYIYIYGVKHSTPQKPSRILLVRIPRNRLKENPAYEFVRGVDAAGKPTWTTDIERAEDVFPDPSDDGIGSVVYAPALKRYLLSTFHGGPGQVSVFDSPTPWGPWTTVYYDETFGGMGASGEGLISEFPQKWMSADGLTLWNVFSCYGGSAKEGIRAHDHFNLIKVTLELYPAK